MLPTGRTEGVYLKVSKPVKKLIDEKRKKENYNLSEWLEERFIKDFMPSIEKLEKEKLAYQEAIINCDKRITVLLKRTETEKRLTLTNKELKQLTHTCDPKFSTKRQRGLFCSAADKKYSMEEFIKLKKKYKDKIYT